MCCKDVVGLLQTHWQYVYVHLQRGDTRMSMGYFKEDQDEIADFEMKLMDIDSQHLGIHAAEYQAIVRMPYAEFARICKDLSSIGDIAIISVTKEGVKFSTAGDIGTANIVCRLNKTVDKCYYLHALNKMPELQEIFKHLPKLLIEPDWGLVN